MISNIEVIGKKGIREGHGSLAKDIDFAFGDWENGHLVEH